MSLESDFKKMEQHYRDFIVAYTLLTTKKVKSRAPEARKALMGVATMAKELRKSIQVYKEKL